MNVTPSYAVIIKLDFTAIHITYQKELFFFLLIFKF